MGDAGCGVAEAETKGRLDMKDHVGALLLKLLRIVLHLSWRRTRRLGKDYSSTSRPSRSVLLRRCQSCAAGLLWIIASRDRGVL